MNRSLLAPLLACALALSACASAEKGPATLPPGDARAELGASAETGTGSCRPWFVAPSADWGRGAPPHSCWNLLWEVPVTLVVVPVVVGVALAPVWAPLVFLR